MRLLLFAIAAACWCLPALGEPKPVDEGSLFSTPIASIRTVIIEPEQESIPESSNLPADSVDLDLMSDEVLIERFRMINGQEPLIPPPSQQTDNLMNTLIVRAFEMDVVRIKKVQISGSLVTAINRRNPLRLLNPLVFAIAW